VVGERLGGRRAVFEEGRTESALGAQLLALQAHQLHRDGTRAGLRMNRVSNHAELGMPTVPSEAAHGGGGRGGGGG